MEKIYGKKISDVIHPSVAYSSTVAKLMLNTISIGFLVGEFANDADEGEEAIFSRKLEPDAESRRRTIEEKIKSHQNWLLMKGYLDDDLGAEIDGPYVGGNYILFESKKGPWSLSLMCPPMIPYGEEAGADGLKNHATRLVDIVLGSFRNVKNEAMAANGGVAPDMQLLKLMTATELVGSDQFRNFPFHEAGPRVFSHEALCKVFHNRHGIIRDGNVTQELDYLQFKKSSRTWRVTDATNGPLEVAITDYWGQPTLTYTLNGERITSR